jgi:transcriptional regulator with XRE-family HTH domain
MAKKFSTLLEKMPRERQERIRDRAHAILIGMALQGLRQSRNLTQKDLAEELGLNQSALSKMERQDDMYISTLRKILGAMGGRLKLIAEFPDTEVVIDQFEEP